MHPISFFWDEIIMVNQYYLPFKVSFFLHVVLLVILYTNGVNADNWEYKLTHTLLTGYDKDIRPSKNHNLTLNVTFGLALAQIIDVDERNMIITTNCWLNQGWIDDKLKWNPEDYDGIEFIHIPTEKIWKPDILLENNADVFARTSSISTNSIIRYNGNVTWLSTVIFKSSCTINVRYFPFDEQRCDMIFASWTFDGFFLDINVNSEIGDTTNYIKNGEWHLVNLTAYKNIRLYSCCEEPYPEIIYQFHIRRRPLYYVFNMVFPCLLITLVAFLGFLMPPGCSEKVSIGITTLLSITVFLMLVAESMPPTSEQLPLLGIYYAVTIGIVSLSTAFAVITLNINHKGNKGKRIPRILKIIFCDYLAKVLGTELSTSIKDRQSKKMERMSKKISTIKNSMTIASNTNNQASTSYKTNLIRNSNSFESTFNNVSEITTNAPKIFYLKRSKDDLSEVNKNKCKCSTQTSNKKNLNSLKSYHSLYENAQKDHSMLNTRILKNSDYVSSTDLIRKEEPFISFIDEDDVEEIEEIQSKMKQNFLRNQLSQSDHNKKSNFNYIPNGTSIDLDLYSVLKMKCNCGDNLNNESNSKQLGYLRKNNADVFKDMSDTKLQQKLDVPTKKWKVPKTQSGTMNDVCNSSGPTLSLVEKEMLSEVKRVLEKQFNPVIKSLMKSIEDSKRKVLEAQKLEQIQNEWSDVAKVIDHFLFYFFPTLTLSSCIIIFSNSPHMTEPW